MAEEKKERKLYYGRFPLKDPMPEWAAEMNRFSHPDYPRPYCLEATPEEMRQLLDDIAAGKVKIDNNDGLQILIPPKIEE